MPRRTGCSSAPSSSRRKRPLASATEGERELLARAASSWDRALRGYSLSAPQKAALVRSGLEAVDRALGAAPDNYEALICKMLLLRLQASLEADGQGRGLILAQAERLLEEAIILQKRAL
ncbi:MAG TPA: hypothetical protein VHJ77_05400 [Vicinamibacterales bacterium]|nr:hypothetical protein [Vicinamibacterales bacterium]